MRNILIIAVLLISVNVLSQDLKVLSDKVDKLNTEIEANNLKIKELQSNNEKLATEIKSVEKIIASKVIENTEFKSYDLYSTGNSYVYKTEDLQGKLFQVPRGDKVKILGKNGDKYKLMYDNQIGYSIDMGYTSEEEIKRILNREARMAANRTPEDKKEIEKRERLLKQYGSHYGNIIANGGYAIGMTKGMIRTSLGNPTNINRSTYTFGVHEQWVYEKKGLYIYFEGDKVTSFQD